MNLFLKRQRKVFRRKYKIKTKNKQNYPVIQIFKSNKYIYGNIVEKGGNVICSVSTLHTAKKKFCSVLNKKVVLKKTEASFLAGIELFNKAQEKNISLEKHVFYIGFRSFEGRISNFIQGFTKNTKKQNEQK